MSFDQREDAAADRNARFAGVSGLFPCRAIGTDLLGLLDVERLAGHIGLQGGALQVHTQLCGPDRRGVGGRTPPDTILQAFRMRLNAQQTRRIGKHRLWVRLGKALPLQHVEEHLGVTAGHIGMVLVLGRGIAEIAPALGDLFARTAADTQLQAASGNQIRRTGILGHIERIFIAHVDHTGADLDAAGLRPHR